jgi:hypothetical protein
MESLDHGKSQRAKHVFVHMSGRVKQRKCAKHPFVADFGGSSDRLF